MSEPEIDGSSAPELEQIPQRLNVRPPQTASIIPTNPAEMLYLAMSQGKGMEDLEKFMDLKDRWEAGEARKAFVAAMSRFKANDIHVSKDKDNLQYKSRYTTLGNLVGTVTPFLSQNGLSAKWDIQQEAQKIRVICVITHSLGHSEQVTMEAPPDASGAKNPIQMIKSTITYLKACTFESICGLASTEANLDDDGNGANGIPAHQADVDRIKAAKTLKECQEIYTEAYRKASAANDKKAMDALLKAKDERKAELQKGSGK